LESRVGLAVDHRGFRPTSLVRFRARLLLHGKERLALEATLRLAEQVGLLDGPVEQAIDSTPMLGAAATQDTVRLVRSGVAKLLGAVSAVDQEVAGELERGLGFDYADPAQKPDCRWRERAERERMLTRVAQDAERALRAVEQTDGLLADERVADAQRLLRELIGRTSRSTRVASRGSIAAPGRGGSLALSIPRCGMAARASITASTATSCPLRRRTRPSR
jgi:hypothetical protein